MPRRMGNEFKGLDLHSAEWFDEVRDYWWNEDFLRFLATRWRVEQVRAVLDVGCGVGHWGRLLSRVLPAAVCVTGVDREPFWVQQAAERVLVAGLDDRFQYQLGHAEALPFEDDSFDVVTCQTLLMHLGDPGQGLGEMIRVARPGGLVLAAEPTNLLGPVLLDAVALGEAPERVASLLRFQLQCQCGKAKVGEGNDWIGESLPALFGSAGLQDVEMRLNDRVNPMVPPYASDAARALADQARESAERALWIWKRETARRYFVAGGGREEEFEESWAAAIAFLRSVADAISAGRYTSAGSGTCYVIWGRKPTR
jgi:SAM-dependent methyltransferase